MSQFFTNVSQKCHLSQKYFKSVTTNFQKSVKKVSKDDKIIDVR